VTDHLCAWNVNEVSHGLLGFVVMVSFDDHEYHFVVDLSVLCLKAEHRFTDERRLRVGGLE